MPNSPLQAQIKSLPKLPGVYQFYDKSGRLLYVGKAKNISKRVSSYFSKQHDSYRLRVMVRNIERIKPIVVETESDALLLENNLIKTHQPKFNILLKDDKTFPWVCIKNEAFPRVFTTRRKVNDGSKYFGPFTSMRKIKTLLNVVRKIYPLRTCNYDLTQEKIAAGKFKRCLEFHLGNCLAPCENLQTRADYDEQIVRIEDIIKGNFKPVFEQLEKEMQAYADVLAFEEAQRAKTKIEILKNYQSKSTVVNPRINNVDVFSIYTDHTHAYVNYLQVTHGSITRSYTLEIKKKLEEDDRQLLELAVTELRQRFDSVAKHLILPFKINHSEELKVTIPKLGDKKKLLDLSLKNTLEYKQERLKQIKLTDPDAHANRILMQMKNDLRLSELPRHIECFDNSNIQGSNPVAACVVFKNAKPSKKDYRHFNIKSVVGPDDFASMEEVVHRRYRRMLDEGENLPQLIVIDGGKGQLNAALKSLKSLGLEDKIATVGIAKKLEELFFPDDPYPLHLDKRSDTLKIIQQLRNEAHRFGITHHRNQRSKSAIHTELEAIRGIGEKTSVDLLKHFKTVKKIKTADLTALSQVVGNAKAQLIYEYFHENAST